MGDADLLAQLENELHNDPNPPVMDIAFDPFDLLEIELIIVKAEALVDGHVQSYREKYRPRFEDPSLFDDFIVRHKTKVRDQIRHMVEDAREHVRKLGYDPEEFDPSGGGLVN